MEDELFVKEVENTMTLKKRSQEVPVSNEIPDQVYLLFLTYIQRIVPLVL